uniref:Uncharacterized protein n=1 Tax=Eptatretus burgeri TaxID=7764 RepID=A0A8C4R9J4_EPTBU
MSPTSLYVCLCDLVKSHLMFAVREEVQELRDQIRNLLERNLQLEEENSLLRTFASAEELEEIGSQVAQQSTPQPSSTASQASP